MSEKARPILMTGWSVQRILADAKTQTRRPIKPQASGYNSDVLDPFVIYPCEGPDDFGDPGKPIRCPYGKPGDLLWVRETWKMTDGIFVDGQSVLIYKADCDERTANMIRRWKSPIFMPRRYSRITLRIKDIRVERVQEISTDDVIAEGLDPHEDLVGHTHHTATIRADFITLWDSIYAKTYSWESNPYVWAIDFVREEKEDE